MSFYAADPASDHQPQPHPPPDWQHLAFVFNPAHSAPHPQQPQQHHLQPPDTPSTSFLLNARPQPPVPPQHHLQQQPPPTHHVPHARRLTRIVGSNAKLPPEAFELAESYRPRHDDFLARNKNPVMVRKPPHYVAHLLKFNDQLHAASARDSLLQFWKPLFATHFAPQAAIHIELKCPDSPGHRSFQLPVEVMPRLWKSKYDAGMISERILLHDPLEHEYSDESVVVECPNTLIVSNYLQSVVLTDGNLRVSFNASKKIFRWEFFARAHREFFAPTAFTPAGPPQSICSKYGIPPKLYELMLVAEAISKLSDKIDQDVNRLVSQAASNPAVDAAAKAAAAAAAAAASPSATTANTHNLANISNSAIVSHLQVTQPALPTEINTNEQATRTAYGELLSQIGDPQASYMEHAMSAKHQLHMTSPSTAGLQPSALPPNTRNDGARGILAHSMGAEDAAAVNAFNNEFAWRHDASQSLHSPEMLNTLIENLRGSLGAGALKQGVQQRPGSGGDHVGAHVVGFSDAHDARTGQSPIDAIDAVAAGQGGWAVDMSTKQCFNDGMDGRVSLNAMTTADGNLSMGATAMGKTNNLRQQADNSGLNNAGLSLFTAQTGTAVDKINMTNRTGLQGTVGGARSGVGSRVLHDLSGVDVYSRVKGGKAKREMKGDSRANGMNVSGGSGLASGGSQGSYSHLSGDIAKKNVKDENSLTKTQSGGKKSRRGDSGLSGREKRHKSGGGNTGS